MESHADHAGRRHQPLGRASSASCLIIKPGADLLTNPSALIALSAALFSAIALVSVNKLSGQNHPDTILFYYFFIASLATLPFAIVNWSEPTTHEWGLLLGVGMFMAVAQLLIILAYQHATASQIAPFNYSVVIFSGLIGWVVWHNTLDWISGVGILLVCAGGILSILLAPDSRHCHGITPVHGHGIAKRIARERSGLRVIIRVQPHVLGREVGRPEAGSRAAFFEDEDDARVAIGGDRFGDRVGVEIDRAAALVEQKPVEVQRHFRGIESDARVAGGRDDAAPVRIGAGDGRFHERAVGDRLGDLPRVLPRAGSRGLRP